MNNPFIDKLLNEGFYGKNFEELDLLRSELTSMVPLQKGISDPGLGAGVELAKEYSLEDIEPYEDEKDEDLEIDSLSFWGGITGAGSTYNIADNIRETVTRQDLEVGKREKSESILGTQEDFDNIARGVGAVGLGMWLGWEAFYSKTPLPQRLLNAGLYVRDMPKRDYVARNWHIEDEVLARRLNKSVKWVRNAKAGNIHFMRGLAGHKGEETRKVRWSREWLPFADPNIQAFSEDLKWQELFEEKWTRLHRISQGGAEVDLDKEKFVRDAERLRANEPERLRKLKEADILKGGAKHQNLGKKPPIKGGPIWEQQKGRAEAEGRTRAVDPNLKDLDPELKKWLDKIRELPTSRAQEFPPEKPGFKEWSINVEGMPADVAEVITPDQAKAWRKVGPESRRLIEGLVRDQIIELGEWDVASGKGKPQGSNLQFEIETMSDKFVERTLSKVHESYLESIKPAGGTGTKVVHTAVAALAFLYGVEAFLTAKEDFEWEDLTEGLGGELNLDPTGLRLPMASLKSLFRPSSLSEEERQAMTSNQFGINMWAITEFLRGLGKMQMGGEESLENMTLGNFAFALQSAYDPRKQWGLMKEIPQSLNDVLVAPLLNLASRIPPIEMKSSISRKSGQSTPMGLGQPSMWE